VLATSPLQLLDLVESTYKFLPNLVSLIPVDHSFLWLDLGYPDPTYVLPVLVAVSTYFSQKAFSPGTTTDANAAAMTRQMQIMMPAMLGWMALSFPSALSLYWVISNLLAVAQYYGLQRSGLVPPPPPKPAAGASARGAPAGSSPARSAPATPPPVAPSGTRPTSRARKVRRKR
jgi:hypothetical protein